MRATCLDLARGQTASISMSEEKNKRGRKLRWTRKERRVVFGGDRQAVLSFSRRRQLREPKKNEERETKRERNITNGMKDEDERIGERGGGGGKRLMQRASEI